MSWQFFLSPLALIYGPIVFLRNKLYDWKVLKTYKMRVPVVSVGNITAGGTGKTPLIHHLVQVCQSKGLNCAVVSRGYRGRVKEPERVDISSLYEAIAKHGDEACMLSWKNPGLAVFTGRDRVLVCRRAIKEVQPDLILADDAFQHRRLGRDLDLLVLDASASLNQYRLLPLGRAREVFSGVCRANLCFLSKVNLAQREKVGRLREKLKLESEQIPVAEVISKTEALRSFDLEKISWRELDSKRCLLLCGIGNPQAFEELVVQSSSLQIVDRLFYRDHFAYTEEDVRTIIERKKSSGADYIISTEKDGVKLVHWSDSLQNLLMVELSVEINDENLEQSKRLSALIDQILI